MEAYIKIDEYIVKIRVFNSQYKNRRRFYPTIYQIITINHMVTHEYYDSIELFDEEHICSTNYDNEHSLFHHNKTLHINNIAIYKSICHSDNYIELNDNLVDLQTNNKINFIIIDKLYAVYIDELEAFYENFFDGEQWKLFPNGFSGICKKYDYKYSDYGGKIEEFYHSNGKIEGKHKIFYNNFYKNKIKSETNYINGQKIGEDKHYDENGNCIEKYYNYSENFNFYEKFNKTGELLISGYYYLNINITPLYNIYNYIKYFF